MSLTLFENISVITFKDLPFNSGVFTDILQKIAAAEINIDMISQSPPTSDKLRFAFTCSDSDIPHLLKVINTIKDEYKITPMVMSGNCKIIVKSSEMVDQAGFASKVFSAVYNANIQIYMITTGVDEISFLISGSDSENTYNVLKNSVQ